MLILEKFFRNIVKVDVVSFDVFDTLLLRPFLKPQDLFYQLENITNKSGFAECRINAEQSAWKKFVNDDKDDVTLDEIYSCMPKKYQSIKQQELQMEYNNLFVNPEIKDVFDFAIQQGKRVIITSDMYLPYDFLYNLIVKKFGTNKFDLFVSCEYGKRKHTGKLFKHILSKLNVEPNKVLHIGDNLVSDYKIPRSLGIQTLLYTKPTDVFLSNRKIKHFYKTHNSLMCRNFLGVLSLAYAYFVHEDKRSYWQNIGFLYGGVLAYTYVRKILEWAEMHKLSDVAFVARDGYTLKRIFDILNKNRQIKSHYIYAPRFTNTLAYLDKGASFVAEERKQVLLKFLAENGVDVQYDDDLDKYAIRLKDFSDTERKEYQQYIANCKIGKKVGVVDSISGSYSAQKLVSKALKDSKVIGFYWWTISKHKQDKSLYQEQFYNGPYTPCFCHLIEFFFAAPEKPIHRILNGAPVYQEHIDKYEQIKIDLYPIISDAMSRFCEIITELNLVLDVSSDLVFEWMNNFVICANRTDFAHFRNIKNGVDQSHTKYDPVLPRNIKKGRLYKVLREIRHIFFRKKKTPDCTKIYILGINVMTIHRAN